MATDFSHLRFDNRFIETLPPDPNPKNFCRQVRGAGYSKVSPTPVRAPRLVAWSKEVAALLDMSSEAPDAATWAEVLSGNLILPGMVPYAACYGGHQFGNWAGQLGDGRAISLGEVVNRAGQRWELQLKGAGPTPYSRRGDGRAVMRSSVREFLCSEAMFHLGVPTTRALSLVATGEGIIRDMFYDGNPKEEPGAIVCRVAPSFIRFGHFEIFTARREFDLLKQLADYTITNHFPCLGPPSKKVYPGWVAEVAERTARMIVDWMRVGFVHGVMNTDNMSVLGLTIDYGPYGWLENYDLQWTPNTTDASGRRYCYGGQPHIGLWNVVRFAEALLPLVGHVEPLQEAVEVYTETMDHEERRMVADKLGLHPRPNDAALVSDLWNVLELVETDMTIFFRRLADVPGRTDATDDELLTPITEAYYAPDQLSKDARARMLDWLRRYVARVEEEGRPDAVRRAAMNRVNPKYVLRNYLAQLAIDEAERGDSAKVHALLEVMRRPYDEQPDKTEYAEKRPEWARHRAGCSMLSCSS